MGTTDLQKTRRHSLKSVLLIVAMLCTVSLTSAQTITEVQPASGKVNETITVTGEHLGKSAVSAVFLSDDKNDYKTMIVEQSDAKVVAKVPQVKPGRYNVSVQTGNKIIIEPVRFTVEE